MNAIQFVVPILLSGVGLAAIGAAPQAPSFTSRVDAVRVDVLVTERGRIVRGLQATDFELRDKGVAQQVDLVTVERLPLRMVLAFDVSDSLDATRMEHLRAAGISLVDQMGPEDEGALLAFTHALSLRSPVTKDRTALKRALERASGFGRTSLVDASYVGMVLGDSSVGRSLLIVFSDGVDTSSWLSADAVLDIARGSGVVVYCVSIGARRNATFVQQLASVTGGALIHIESTKDLSATFHRTLDEFRQRYVLTFTPRPTPEPGWHPLQVRVKGRRLTVHARAGYVAGS